MKNNDNDATGVKECLSCKHFLMCKVKAGNKGGCINFDERENKYGKEVANK